MAYGTEMADKPAMSSKKKVTKVTKVTEKKKFFRRLWKKN